MKSESSRRDVGDAAALRIALVVSEYHNAVTDGLRDGAMAVLREAGAPDDEVTVLHVPGAFEVPLVARLAAETHRFDVIICLGCIVRGETPHFEYLASVVAHGIAGASQDTGVPMTFGVLTTNTYEEAVARAGDGPQNKGREAAKSAVQLVHVVRGLTAD